MKIRMTITDLFFDTESDVTTEFKSIAAFKQFIENRSANPKDGLLVDDGNSPIPYDVFLGRYSGPPVPFQFMLLNGTQRIDVHRIQDGDKILFDSGKYGEVQLDADFWMTWPLFWYIRKSDLAAQPAD